MDFRHIARFQREFERDMGQLSVMLRRITDLSQATDTLNAAVVELRDAVKAKVASLQAKLDAISQPNASDDAALQQVTDTVKGLTAELSAGAAPAPSGAVEPAAPTEEVQPATSS